jgi:hypothetical protein
MAMIATLFAQICKWLVAMLARRCSFKRSLRFVCKVDGRHIVPDSLPLYQKSETAAQILAEGIGFLNKAHRTTMAVAFDAIIVVDKERAAKLFIRLKALNAH